MTKKAVNRCVEENAATAEADGESSSLPSASSVAHKKRRKRHDGRISSLMTADQMFSHKNGRLRWPAIAPNEESRQHVEDVKTLSEVSVVSGFFTLT